MEVEFFAVGGGNFRGFTLILINTANIFAVVNLIHGGLFLEISLIILFFLFAKTVHFCFFWIFFIKNPQAKKRSFLSLRFLLTVFDLIYIVG